MQEKLVGYAKTQRDTLTQGGRDVLRLKSTTFIKVALLGSERSTQVESETLVQPHTFEPITYQMTETTNDVVRHIKCDFDDQQVRIWTYGGDDEMGDAKESQLEDEVAILGNNNFAHWQLILAKAAEQLKDNSAEISVFLPGNGTTEKLELLRVEAQHDATLWRLAQADLQILVDPESSEVIQMELPAQQTRIELTESPQ